MQQGIRIAKWSAGIVLLTLLLLLCAVWMAGNTDPGRRLIEHITAAVTRGHVTLSGLGGSFPSDLTLTRLELSDAHGVWLYADRIALRWSPLDLMMHSIHVDRLQMARLHMERTPVSDEPSTGKTTLPHIVVAQLSVDAVELGALLVGTPASLSLRGSGRLRSLDDAIADLVAKRLNGEGDYTVHLNLDPRRMEASVTAHEPAGGPLEHLLQLPGLGALSATVTLAGPRTAEKVSLVLDAGELRARAQGVVDLVKSSAGLEFALNSPALQLRPDIEWQQLDVRGTWHGTLENAVADGQLRVAGLKLAATTQIAGLAAIVTAKEGTLSMAAQADGVQIPGPQPRLFAADPLKVTASLGLKDVARPLTLAAAHRLFTLKAHALLAGKQHATLDLRLPEVAPFAALGGQDVQGDAAIKATLTSSGKVTALSADALMGLTGGTAAWVGMAGPRLALQLSGFLSPDKISIDKLRVAARSLTLSASGNAPRKTTAGIGFTESIGDLQAQWQLDVADLTMLSPDVKGRLKATGRVSGPLNAMSSDAALTSTLSLRDSPSGTIDANVHARGLPGAPSGSVGAHGMFDGAPLQVNIVAERAGGRALRVAVRRLDWKSAHAGGDVTLGANLAQARGQLQLHLGQLGDLDRLLGTTLSGSVDGSASIEPGKGPSAVQVDLAGKDLVAGQINGAVQLKAGGTLDALGLELDAQLPNLGGVPASLSVAAALNRDTQELRLTSAVLNYRGQALRLLAPAAVAFANGLTVAQLRLGLQDATFELEGRLTPSLDVRAALSQVKPTLVNAFAPGLLADGLIEARARLQGTLADPTGRVQLDATRIRLADDAATGLPAVDVHARAQLANRKAVLDARLNAGSGTSMSATGGVPFDAQGKLDLKITGDLDLAMANPLLEARGLHAAGKIAIDAAVTGFTADPKIGGNITLANGNVRDYGRGIYLSDISADIAGSEGALQIKAFKATAGTGSIGMTGSVGILQPQMPLDLKITAKNAQPVASSIVTATLDADVSVKGTVRRRLDVDGTVHISHAVIGIPNSLPPDVAVLDVRRRGKAAAAQTDNPLVIGVDIDVQAPREILIQGRGLDAEMGGDVHLTGTLDALTASGGFDLQRGTFSLAGNRLNFLPSSKVSFDGAGLRKKIDPTLDFTAQTVVTDTTITLKIAGFADAPRFELSSSPQRGQDEIMGYLLFGGQSVDKLSALQVAQIGAALATLSGVGGNSTGPLAKIQKSLGLDRLSVGSGTKETATGTANSGAAIEAGRYVSKRVYIEGKQSTTGSSQVQVDVDLTKHLKLQTRLGTGGAATQGTTPENDPGSSIGLSYQFEYQ